MTIVDSPELQKRSTIIDETSTTSIQQRTTEQECSAFFVDLGSLSETDKDHLRRIDFLKPNGKFGLMKEKHVSYLRTIWERKLRQSFLALDASRPWIIYWCLHGLDLLKASGDVSAEDTVDALRICWNSEEGGFGGGSCQMPHAATTYAAVLALSILASRCKAALDLLESCRNPLMKWMALLVDESTGAVRMHVDGEIDVRASYCLSVVAKLLNIPIQDDLMAEFVQKCQTWEGGFGAEPGAEAHGGYTFCGVAALHLLGKDVIDNNALLGWLSSRQLSYEGGFSGRSNKLVDGCYSFWQGSASALASAKFDAPMLERYILLCGQDVSGGLRDKPSKPRDFYHTCYCLSGLSVANQLADEAGAHFGSYDVPPTDFAFNIQLEYVAFVQKHFQYSPI